MEVWELIVSCFNHLLEAHAHMSSFVANISSLAKIADPETFNMVMKAAVETNDSGQCPRALPESSPRSTPKDHSRRMPVPAGKSHPPPAHISHTGTMVWTHQASSCSGLAPSQMQVFSMAAPPRRLALHLRCEPNNCQSCCWVRFTLVDPLELPRANVSGLTPRPMREM